jgi:hypothetical protein
MIDGQQTRGQPLFHVHVKIISFLLFSTKLKTNFYPECLQCVHFFCNASGESRGPQTVHVTPEVQYGLVVVHYISVWGICSVNFPHKIEMAYSFYIEPVSLSFWKKCTCKNGLFRKLAFWLVFRPLFRLLFLYLLYLLGSITCRMFRLRSESFNRRTLD